MKEGTDSVSIRFNSTKIEISSALSSTDMRTVWRVPCGTLLLDTLPKHSAATAAEHRFAGAGVDWLPFRHFSSRSTESVPAAV